MTNKNGIIALTVIISLLCAYYLSFTFVSQKIQKQADAFATTDKGIDYMKRQKYLDSVGKIPVYNLGFADFTYNQVKNNELHLGLDLQGGMHVVLEVSPVEILRGLANNTDDANFDKAIKAAQERQKTSQAEFTTLFFEEYERIAGQGKLSLVFANSSSQGRIDVKTPETQIKTIIQSEVDGAIDRAYNIIKTRIDKFGTTQPNVQRIPNTGRIQVELPGVDNPERVRKLLQGVAKLEFWEVYEAQDYIQYIQKANDYLVKRQKASSLSGDSTVPQAVKDTLKQASVTDTTKKAADATDLAKQLDKDGKTISDTSKKADPKDVSPLFAKLASPRELVYEAADTAQITSLIHEKEIRNLFPANMVFAWDAKASFEDKEKGKSYYTLYVLKKNKNGKASMGGEVVEDSRGDLDRVDGKPYVSMQMNPEGARAWRKLTGANIKNRIAIVLDGLVYSAPVVNDEIGGGNSQISGNFTIEEAQDLANILKAGKLPAPTRIVEEAVVGPSLGKEAISQGLISTLVGLALVIGFMIFYYAQAGVVANVALSFNIFFLIGIMAQLGSALTLPGIAGIVLTFGMAVDANVLIYERVREELKGGKSIIEALELGYEKAFASIFDSNVTTLLTGVILLLFGSGPIKGFAVTLVIGILISFFTAVYVSKVIIFWWAKNYPNSMKFGNSMTNNFATGTNYDFISKGKRKMAYTVSLAIIALGIVAIVVKGGMNLGVDFKGGRTYIVEFKDAVVPSEVKDKLADDFKNQGTEVKSYNSNNKIKVTTTYLIEDETEEADKQVQTALEGGLKEFAANNPKIVSSSKVGATIADDIKSSAWQSTLAALLGIFLYIVIRFQRWQFGLGAVIAELHDVLIVIAIYAIAGLLGFNFEVDQVFVASILTIVGYSINDKVVVFDRIREFMNKRMEGDEIEKTLNASVNDTLSRTLITAVASLLVLFVMMIFGGQTLQGFCFSMIIGILFGTYSSIYVSTAIVADTLEKYGNKDEQPVVVTEEPKV